MAQPNEDPSKLKYFQIIKFVFNNLPCQEPWHSYSQAIFSPKENDLLQLKQSSFLEKEQPKQNKREIQCFTCVNAKTNDECNAAGQTTCQVIISASIIISLNVSSLMLLAWRRWETSATGKSSYRRSARTRTRVTFSKKRTTIRDAGANSVSLTGSRAFAGAAAWTTCATPRSFLV